MLILTRYSHESINIGGNINVKILSVNGGLVKLGIEAPKEISVDRHEIYLRKMNEVVREGVEESGIDMDEMEQYYKEGSYGN